MAGKQSHRGKELRDEDRLTDKQRETVVNLYRSHGLDAVLERFGGEPWNMTEWSVEAIIRAARPKRRAGTDWQARFASYRNAGQQAT